MPYDWQHFTCPQKLIKDSLINCAKQTIKITIKIINNEKRYAQKNNNNYRYYYYYYSRLMASFIGQPA